MRLKFIEQHHRESISRNSNNHSTDKVKFINNSVNDPLQSALVTVETKMNDGI